MRGIINFKSFILVFTLLSVYVIIFSESGILERKNLVKKRLELEKRIERFKDRNRELNKDLAFYRKGMLKPRDRLESGYLERGERPVFFKGVNKYDNNTDVTDNEKSAKERFSLKHMRILWAVVSILILLFYITWSLKNIRTE